MRTATFKGISYPDADQPLVIGWFGAKYDYYELMPKRQCLIIHCNDDLTQQEQDDITSNCSGEGFFVKFSA